MTSTAAQSTNLTLERSNTELRTALADTDEARMVAQAANRAKSEFLAIMSHELRIPLNALMGSIEILTMELCGPLTADQRDKLTRMRRSADHLLALIDQVLDFGHPGAGRAVAIGEGAEIGECLRAAAVDVKPQALRKGLTLTIVPPPDPMVLTTDVATLRRILFHLLSNAVKYTEHGEIHVTARRIVGGDVEVLVRGPGLGLAIAQRFTPLLGREIAVTSTPGLGTTFTLRLPTSMCDATAAPVAS